MVPQDHDTTSLPRHLLNELGLSAPRSQGRSFRHGPLSRKETRKSARHQKKKDNVKRSKSASSRHFATQKPTGTTVASRQVTIHSQNSLLHQKPVKSTLKVPKSDSQQTAKQKTPQTRPVSTTQSISEPRPSRGAREKLAEDDAEIAALEKALGVKDKSKLPKSFGEDGLDVLLEGLQSGSDDERGSKRKRADYEEFLARKRSKSTRNDADHSITRESDRDIIDSGFENPFSSDEASDLYEGEEDNLDVVSLEGTTENLDNARHSQKTRENPYIAPVQEDQLQSAGKYVPPSLRDKDHGSPEDLTRLRRQVQGLLNRLSEDNILSILADVEKLYSSNPRQHVSQVLLDLVVGLFCDATSLQDTFVILHAGFVAAIYKSVTADLGPQILQRIDEEFMKYHKRLTSSNFSHKQALNLISLLSFLYTFHVITSTLIYDYIRIFLSSLTEPNAELLLKLIRNAGPQLRQDDASSLKDITTLLSAAAVEQGDENLSVRTKFMIETMHNLRNNKMKTGQAASAITSEHTLRMKKTLGSLNNQKRALKASEPLNISLQDLRDTEKRGRWWLVGASYRDPSSHKDQDRPPGSSSPQNTPSNPEDSTLHSSTAHADFINPTTLNFHSLALQNRMTTPVRRAIFVALLSAEDYQDAYTRLQKLHLKTRQREEIPKVLIHCAASEVSPNSKEGRDGNGITQGYNPYYTLVARKLCQSDRKLKIGLKFACWGFWNRVRGDADGEEEEDDGYGMNALEEEENSEHTVSLGSIVNVAKLYGTLVAEGTLGFDVLKPLDLIAIRSQRMKVWVEVFFITVILEVLRSPVSESRRRPRRQQQQQQQHIRFIRDEEKLVKAFVRDRAMQKDGRIAGGVKWFLRKVVKKTDIAGGGEETEVVRWACRVLGDALKGLVMSAEVDGAG